MSGLLAVFLIIATLSTFAAVVTFNLDSGIMGVIINFLRSFAFYSVLALAIYVVVLILESVKAGEAV